MPWTRCWRRCRPIRWRPGRDEPRAAPDRHPAPIVAGGHGHHGGAWKVAYADFVTAMMAFFLLLWLISSASDETKQGPRRVLQQRHGQYRPARRGRRRARRHDRDAEFGAAPADLAVRPPPQLPSRPEDEEAPETRHRPSGEPIAAADADGGRRAEPPSDAARGAPAGSSGQGVDPRRACRSTPELRGLKDNLLFEQRARRTAHRRSSTGTRLPMFPSRQRRRCTPIPAGCWRSWREAIAELPNRVSIRGHTDALPFAAGRRATTTGDLSADRANATRLVADRCRARPRARRRGRRQGRRRAAVAADPDDPRNRRISVVLLRESKATAARPATGRHGCRSEPGD